MADKLLLVLTSSHLSPKAGGEVHMACVRSAVLHGSEAWGRTTSDLVQLHRNNCTVIRWICGTKDQDETLSSPLLQKLGIKVITTVLRSIRLRWHGYVQCASSFIRDLTLPGPRRRGRHRNTLPECVKTDVGVWDLAGVDVPDRVAGKTGVSP